MPIIKKGSKGEDVKKLQLALGIEADGIFGSGTEKKVKEFQKAHGLKDDGVVGQKTWDVINKIEAEKNEEEEINAEPIDLLDSIVLDPIDVHLSKKQNREIKYIAIHFTAGASSMAGKAKANRDVFLDREASADFVIDDETIIQVNPDIRNMYCWAVGDGKGKNGITNANTVSIEICSNLKKGTKANVANHSGWFFTEECLDKAVELTKILMYIYNVSLDNVVRHYDASGKYCPGIIGWNDGCIYDEKTGKKTTDKNTSDKWLEFKKRLEENEEEQG